MAYKLTVFLTSLPVACLLTFLKTTFLEHMPILGSLEIFKRHLAFLVLHLDHQAPRILFLDLWETAL